MHSVFGIAANRFFRDSLGDLINREPSLRLLDLCEFSLDVVERVAELDPDVVVLSPSWNDTEFRATRAIHEAAPRAKILMIGMDDDRESFLKAVRAGAVGYLLKDASAEQIVSAIAQLAREPYVCPRHMVWVLFDFVALHPEMGSPVSEKGTGDLTQRENELISLLAEGLSNKEIASRLNLSEHTVKNHVHSILRKTGSKTRAALIHRRQMESSRIPSSLPSPSKEKVN